MNNQYETPAGSGSNSVDLFDILLQGRIVFFNATKRIIITWDGQTKYQMWSNKKTLIDHWQATITSPMWEKVDERDVGETRCPHDQHEASYQAGTWFLAIGERLQ